MFDGKGVDLLATVGVEEVCVHAGLARVLAGAGRRAHTEGEATPVHRIIGLSL